MTVNSIVVTLAGTATEIPAGDSGTWTLTGPCDGISECAIFDSGTAVASTGASPFATPGEELQLVPGGPGIYTSTFEFPLDGCGTGVGNIVMNFAGDGFAATYDVTTQSSEACPLDGLSASHTGVRTG